MLADRKKASEELPDLKKLVLCWRELTGFCLRSRDEGGYWFDEHNNIDDSELGILYWWDLPWRDLPEDR